MVYFYADIPYKARVFRILRSESNSRESSNEMLKRQGAIQVLAPDVITLFGFRGRYMHTARTQAEQTLVADFLNADQIPSYGMLVWVQTFLEETRQL